jgi:hypothetical protein
MNQICLLITDTLPFPALLNSDSAFESVRV